MDRTTLAITLEALTVYEATWEAWLTLKNTTEEEKELARVKLLAVKDAVDELTRQAEKLRSGKASNQSERCPNKYHPGWSPRGFQCLLVTGHAGPCQYEVAGQKEGGT